MMIIAAVAIIVVGPKDLPGMLRQIGKTIGGVKRMAGDFQRQFNDALKEAEVDDLKNLTSTKGFDPLEDARKSMEDLQKSINEPVPVESAASGATANEVTNAESVEKAAQAPKKTSTRKPAAKKTASSAAKTNRAKSSAVSKTTSGKATTKASGASKSGAKTRTTRTTSASKKTVAAKSKAS